MRRLALVVNNPDFLVSHRLVLVRGALAAGYEVHAIAPPGPGMAVLERVGARVHPWALDRKGQAVLAEGSALARLTWLYARLRPDVVHHVTIKPVLYGTFAARAAGVRGVVNAVSGLGFVFLSSGRRAALRRRAVALAYRVALATPGSVTVLQNDDDEADLRRLGALGAAAQVVKIRGSGVDLARFTRQPEAPGTPLVVLPARLLKDKGVLEFVEAARLLKRAQVAVRLALVGAVDPGNPAAVTQQQVDAWVAEGVVEAWGFRADMPEVFRQATVVCLPSYREGMPKALLEAGATERALVTTDVPGCRDAVDLGRAGVLVPVRDPAALARALGELLRDENRRRQLAARAASFVEQNHDERRVLAAHLAVYDRVGEGLP
jgi:glycosyltransferase involved in cell wall biosynthesis